MTAVSSPVVFRAVRPHPDRIPSRLTYRSADPAVVVVDLYPRGEEAQRWLIGRELLRDGLDGAAGCGDVVFRSLMGRTWMTLSVGDVEIVMWAPTRELAGFLEASFALVPDGAEWDLCVEEILGNAFAGETS